MGPLSSSHLVLSDRGRGRTTLADADASPAGTHAARPPRMSNSPTAPRCPQPIDKHNHVLEIRSVINRPWEYSTHRVRGTRLCRRLPETPAPESHYSERGEKEA